MVSWEKIGQFLKTDWPLLLPVVLGFLAVYCLLPRVRRNWLVPGAVAGAAAIVAAGSLLVCHGGVLIEQVLFYTFSGIAILGGGLMLAQHNPVRAALSFALVVLSTCGLFLLLAAPFLMAATIIIYGGAIIITFLFVVMLAQQAGLTSADRRSREPFLSCLAGFVLLASLLYVLDRNYDARAIEKKYEPAISQLQKASAAAEAKNFDEMKRVLEEPVKRQGSEKTKELAEELTDLLPKDLHADVYNTFDDYLDSEQYEKAQAKCARFMDVLIELRNGAGSLRPAAKLPLSPLGGRPASAPFTDKRGLSARNVEALGQTLFTDYLIAVEVGGVLLLVATIGAIIIAGRGSPRKVAAGGKS